MRSALDDRTTVARIRDAALDLFGTGGVDATSVRSIAESAGVSAALVLHHFGSKDGLRRACDAYILTEVIGRNAEMLDNPDLEGAIQRWMSDHDAYRPSLTYLSRMITDGTVEGQRLFDGLVERTLELITEGVEHGLMNPPTDPRTTAVVVAAHGLVPLILEQHIGRALGGRGLSPEVLRQLTIPTLELYTHGLYADTSALDAARAALGTEPQPAPSHFTSSGGRT